MKTSILIVMLDFLVCSLLLFVIGTGGKQTQFATSAPPAVHEEFSAAAMQAQQEEWNREYEQQTLLTQLEAETAEKERLRATLAAREANLQAVAAEKARVEQAQAQTEQQLAGVETQLSRVAAERERLQKEGEAAKETLAKLQIEQVQLQQQKAELEQHAQQLGQTVASQQATISTLSEEVRASQARVEAQLDAVAQDQQQMASTLTRLDEFARTLPGILQQTVVDVRKEQEAAQENVAAIAENLKGMQAGLSAEEKAALMQAIGNVAKGQQDMQSQLNTLMTSGQGEQLGQNLDSIQAGQEELRQQAARLGEQIESIKARGPGPFKAVKGARLELATSITTRTTPNGTISRFKSVAYPPVVRVNGRSFVIANYRTLGLAWWGMEPAIEITDLNYTVRRAGNPPWSGPLDAPACVLGDDPHVVAIELDRPAPGLITMELAGPDAVLQTDQRKLHVFKSTAAGLSFEADTSPDLSDARYLVVKRQLRGIAGWFENPSNRADIGDYVVTADGKLVGIMITREKCFVLSKDTLSNCALTIPLTDKQQFHRAVQQYPPVK
ncbi:MAG TPA: hypothetical protein VLZ12_12170 [Verrucomicrobiae bacterium]|nr:hypothetical protein [Verrucomicrobiae bacterium]